MNTTSRFENILTPGIRHYSTYEARSGAIPIGAHVARFTPASDRPRDPETGIGYAVETDVLGTMSDPVSTSHLTLNGRKVVGGADDFYVITDVRANER